MAVTILRGNICHAPRPEALSTRKDAFVVCEDGVCRGVFDVLPVSYAGAEVTDCGDCLIIPGMVDLHLHAPQFSYRGTGMDCELLDWLEIHTFPEESKYADPEYAERAYGMFADQMKRSATTRASIFATIHREATLKLMNLMEQTGLVSYVGKVNMDRNAPPALLEGTAEAAARETTAFAEAALDRGFCRTRPILTPRFIPTCSDELLRALKQVQRRYALPVQSHLSENPGEVETVRRLAPEARFYGDAYDRFGLFGGDAPTIMAHCIYSTAAEIELMRDRGVWVAHCPNSNMNIGSGIAPMRKYLSLGLRAGLGSDVAGGQTESMFRAITDAIQVSKLYWRYINSNQRALSFSECFYLATKGGGSFFGKVGSFEPGYEFDALVIDDSIAPHPQPMSLEDRLERAVYLGLDRDGIRAKYVQGEAVFRK